jgi:plastocyanin
MAAHDDIVRTSPARMAKGMLFVIIPTIITLYLSISLWHFTSSFPPMVSVPKTSPGATGATASPGGGSSSMKPDTITIPQGASVQGNPSYIPQNLVVKKGDVITVTNDDNAPHTFTAVNGKSFDSSIIMPKKSAKINTASLAPGDYPFHCTIHTYMTGKLTVK